MAGPRKDISKTTRDIFVNRDGPIDTIERAVAGLNDADSTVLVFHGPGGQGKTALCRYVARHLPSSVKIGERIKPRIAELDLLRSRGIRPTTPVFQRAHVRVERLPKRVDAWASVISHRRNRFTTARAIASPSAS